MEPRRKLYAAADVGVKTSKIDGFMWNMEAALLGQNQDGSVMRMQSGADDDAVHPIATFDQIKIVNQNILNAILVHANAVNNVKTNISLDQSFIEIDFSRSDIEYDIEESRVVSVAINWNNINSNAVMELLLPAFENFIPKFNINPNPNLHLPKSLIWASCVNDLLDVIAYKLQRIHSETGQSTSLSTTEIRKQVRGHLNVLERFNQTPYVIEDSVNMLSAYNYIDINLADAKNFNDLAALGVFIDTNVEKLILVRRAWAT